MTVLRIIDANFNRCREGLRVIEEYARFITNNATLSQQFKTFRHDLQKCENAFAKSGLNARDTAGDVGTTISTPTEGNRPSVESVIIASFKRVQEALRVLEEYTKIERPQLAKKLEKLRYQSYTLEQATIVPLTKTQRMYDAKLYALITKDLCYHSPTKTAEMCIKGGIDIIQLREKEMPDKAFLKQAQEVKRVLEGSGVILLINDRIPIAQTIDADGVHLGQDDLPQKEARALLGDDKIIGRSTHSVRQAQRAEKEGADYIGVGPVWETNTKKHRRSVGLELVSAVSHNIGIPYYPIGSIKSDNAQQVIDAGATRYAVCTGITMTRNVTAMCRAFNKLLEE